MAELDPDLLERCDALRYEDPRQALRLATTYAKTASREQLPLVLGICASANRLLGDLGAAGAQITTALELAERLPPDLRPRTLADLRLRQSYVLGEAGRFREALDCCRLAAADALLAGDEDSVGRAFVDQSRWYYYLGEIELCKNCLKRAAPRINENSYRTLFSIQLGLAHCDAHAGNLLDARKRLEASADLAARVGPALSCTRLWLQAELAERQKDLEAAAMLYRQTAETGERFSVLNSAIAGLHSVRLFLEIGRRTEAAEVLMDMARYVERFPVSNELLSGAIVDLICQRENLRLDAVQAIISQMQKTQDKVAHNIVGDSTTHP